MSSGDRFRRGPLYVGGVNVSFDAADPDSILTSTATRTTAQTYSATNLNGVYGSGSFTFRNCTITTASATNAYSLSAVTLNGTSSRYPNGGETDSVTLTQASGGETLEFSNVTFTSITSISIPAMANSTGHFTVGTSEAPSAPIADGKGILVGSAGDLVVQTTDGSPLYLYSVPASTDLPIGVVTVFPPAYGTTASSIVILK